MFLNAIPGFLRRGLLLMSLSAVLASDLVAADWRTASRAPAGLAPDPAMTKEAVVQVYAARAIRWRGYFGVHSWVAVKPTGADAFTVFELMGYQTRRTGNGVRVSQRAADGYWFGNRPTLLADVRGPGVDAVIDRIHAAAKDYPYAEEYRIWPGPNSNTFIAHLLRSVPELRVDLPAHAIGKDYLGGQVLAATPSRTGAQVSFLGALGFTVGWAEGLELNIIGLSFGINPKRLGIELPLLGDVGVLDPGRPRQLPGVSEARGSD